MVKNQPIHLSVERLAPRKMNQMCAAAFTDGNIRVPESKKQISHAGTGQWRRNIRRKTQLAVNTLQFAGFPCVGEESGISNPRESFRKNMGKKTADELHRRKADEFLFSGIPVRNGKGNSFTVIILNPTVGDGGAESVPGEVINGVAFAIKGSDNMTYPFCRV